MFALLRKHGSSMTITMALTNRPGVPLAYVQFDAHDRYAGSTSYEIETLFRLFLLKECHGWDHETSLVEYLTQHPDLCDQLGLESVPNQSTLWRSWHHRFTADLQDTVQTAARTILIKAQNAGVSVPREPERQSRRHHDESTESDPDDQTILNQVETVADRVSDIAFPAFSLDRGEGCEIHENAYWNLQTYLGLRENLAVNEGARSFIHESTRNRTPLGHAHREHVRDLSIEQIRETYRQAVSRLLDRVAETEEFFRAGIVAIDITESDPFTGGREGYEDEIIERRKPMNPPTNGRQFSWSGMLSQSC
jgi:hypothetical protein